MNSILSHLLAGKENGKCLDVGTSANLIKNALRVFVHIIEAKNVFSEATISKVQGIVCEQVLYELLSRMNDFDVQNKRYIAVLTLAAIPRAQVDLLKSISPLVQKVHQDSKVIPLMVG